MLSISRRMSHTTDNEATPSDASSCARGEQRTSLGQKNAGGHLRARRRTPAADVVVFGYATALDSEFGTSRSGAGPQMYAQNFGLGSSRWPREITMPIGS